ncbi:tRNA uridine-5-carboxymethylaminomethyl(34) synthesis GTPase MnmE [Iodidimonas gelatinilytica]|uniref:tRNA uridine-5-carboxymethylaminomethyl(34) synthesis GTPase MnmE n=1 Tax=Iodidimonas gelatinilytica TaxID=1236966 RepID=UPI001230845D|nr:tRNA uridine-5-carboxymethylaminomethyl(34) synthesis GTPase MnmE [Iodidimonas gelatinilytica]
MTRLRNRECDSESIFALASARGRAGVSVIRISGPQAALALQALTEKPLPTPRMAQVRALYDPVNGAHLDDALVLYFKAPASFTGEDVVELHVHGGRAVLDGVLDALSRIEGLRPALAGEFSRRAFENGRMDLTEAEGINDLVMAETALQRMQALRQMGGALGALYERWRMALLEALARIEADIDFPDEDLPEDMTLSVKPSLEALCAEMKTHLADGRRGERLRNGVSIVLLGEPNVGKSSLLNTIAKRDAAIVSDIAGTTRDVIEVALDLDGYPATLIDTAGLRETAHSIESEGVRRALERAEHADIRLVLVEAKDWPALPEPIADLLDEEAILVVNKGDCLKAPSYGQQKGAQPTFVISVTEQQGLDALMACLTQKVTSLCDIGEAPAITRIRHRMALQEAVDCLERFFQSAQQDAVLAAEDVRLATRALGRITGRVDVESLLDIVFSSFCIGK